MKRIATLFLALFCISQAQPVVTASSDGYPVSYVESGKTVTLTVNASGPGPLTYQWRKGGVNIAGATGASYVLSNIQPPDSGDFSVVVSNSIGNATSNVKPITAVSTQPLYVATPPVTGNTPSSTDPRMATGSPFLAYQSSVISSAGSASVTVNFLRDPIDGSFVGAWSVTNIYPNVSKRGEYWAVIYPLTVANSSATLTGMTVVQSVVMFKDANGKSILTFNTTKNANATAFEMVYLTSLQPTISKRGDRYLTVIVNK